MVVSEDCHGTALHKGLEIAHGSELRTLNIFTTAFASNTTTDYVNNNTKSNILPITSYSDRTSPYVVRLLHNIAAFFYLAYCSQNRTTGTHPQTFSKYSWPQLRGPKTARAQWYLATVVLDRDFWSLFLLAVRKNMEKVIANSTLLLWKSRELHRRRSTTWLAKETTVVMSS